jgi:uncharacterized lipoprotein YbaY
MKRVAQLSTGLLVLVALTGCSTRGIDNPATPETVSVAFTCHSSTATIDGLAWHRQ